MSARLTKQINVELEQLEQLLDLYKPLIEKCHEKQPDLIELSALGAMLHAFYTGVENIFKRVVVETGGTMPRGEYWHSELLNAVAQPAPGRERVISSETRLNLKQFLEFRHVFRQGYSFQLKWEKMSPLVGSVLELFAELKQELEKFSDHPVF